MIILGLRTDKPEAELYLLDGNTEVNKIIWQAHRELAETLHGKITELLNNRTLSDLQGIVVYQGPGSFTGLRIGISVANALASSLKLPIVGGSSDIWIKDGINCLLKGENDQIVLPEYGSPVHITAPRK
jgi:tRNA threonylcarbamoyladenosine biosynthesis protein TsaB